jgi:hypothetical protein
VLDLVPDHREFTCVLREQVTNRVDVVDYAPQEVLRMLMPFIAFMARCAVSAAFVLSAFWKIRHPAEFRVALAATVNNSAFQLLLQKFVPALELIVAIALLLPYSVGTVGAIAAACIVIALGSTLIRRDLSAGCGCWSAPQASRAALIIRNIILVLLSGASSPVSVSLPWHAVMFCLLAGMLLGLLIMEMPTIVRVVRSSERIPI